MALTDKQIKSMTHSGLTEKREYISDGQGLYLTLSTTGNKSWIIKYRFNHKQKNYTIGKYPDVSLAEARYQLQEIKKLIAQKIDPAIQKKQINTHSRAFKDISLIWFNTFNIKWTIKYSNQVIRRLENHVFPTLGDRDIQTITAKDILSCMRKMESKGIGETTTKTLQHIRSIFDFAVIETVVNHNPANRLSNNLKPINTENLPALPQNLLTTFLHDLIMTGAEIQTKCALLLLMLTAVRMGSLRSAKWVHFDLEKKLWNIPAENMKQGRPFTVTLSTWAIEILNQLFTVTGKSNYLFPSLHKGISTNPYMSENTIGKLINKMGYDGKNPYKPKVVPHGFRSLFTDICNEKGFNTDAIERALDHLERNTTRRAYLRSDFIEGRTI